MKACTICCALALVTACMAFGAVSLRHPDSMAGEEYSFVPDLSNAVYPADVWSWVKGGLTSVKDGATGTKYDNERVDVAACWPFGGILDRLAQAVSGSQFKPAVTEGIALGIYQPQADTSGTNIDRYTSEAGRKPAFAWLPMTWQQRDGSYRQFDPGMLEEFRTRGIMPGLTWNPAKGPIEAYHDRQAAINQPDCSWQAIISGKHDLYIAQFAKDAAAYHHPFVLRMLHEMDGTWYPWGYSVNGNTNPADYVTAYRHIVDIFRKEDAANVQFVWCPCVLNPGGLRKYGAMLKQAYPGDDYVDWVALDGYSTPKNDWKSLQEVFQPSYDFITGFSARPMILWEVGAMENPADPMARANWIKQGFLTTIPRQLPKVKVVVWFNSKDGSGRDFSLQTSPNAVAAWKQVIASPLYQGSLPQ